MKPFKENERNWYVIVSYCSNGCKMFLKVTPFKFRLDVPLIYVFKHAPNLCSSERYEAVRFVQFIQLENEKTSVYALPMFCNPPNYSYIVIVSIISTLFYYDLIWTVL